MLATKVRQKDSLFYFVSYPAEDLLRHVKFSTRYDDEETGEKINGEGVTSGDDISRFITKVESSDKAFQRNIKKAKVRAIKDFYENAQNQPPLPGTVLLYTSEKLSYNNLGTFENVGNLMEPANGYTIIDGQHRLAALHFYINDNPDEGNQINVPCVIFDGHSEDFATEMFVIVNSTATRINKSHIIDLMNKTSFSKPKQKLAARIVEMLYSESGSPLRYRINRLGGQSKQAKWILQSDLYNVIHKWIDEEIADNASFQIDATAVKYYLKIRNFLNAAEKAFGEAWNHDRFMVTTAVTIKALIRVAAKLSKTGSELMEPKDGEDIEMKQRWERKLEPWKKIINDFRKDGFYQRFAAKGQVERVGIIYTRLAKGIGL